MDFDVARSSTDAVGARLASTEGAKYPNRKKTRYEGFDYRSEGAYFITVVTEGRKAVFGSISETAFKPSQRGLIVEQCWLNILSHRPNVIMDEYIVMPNHFHGIVFIEPVSSDSDAINLNGAAVGATLASAESFKQSGRGASAGSLSAIVGGFKSAVTREINRVRSGAANKLWQRGFHDRIIRDKNELNAIRNYILRNPENWWFDEDNPDRKKEASLEEFIAEAMALAVEASLAPTIKGDGQ